MRLLKIIVRAFLSHQIPLFLGDDTKVVDIPPLNPYAFPRCAQTRHEKLNLESTHTDVHRLVYERCRSAAVANCVCMRAAYDLIEDAPTSTKSTVCERL